jgi:N6-L-threonylcarbamoyladenine synthase
VIGGGFSANSQLRAKAAERAKAAGVTVRIPPPKYCTDNGAMIAALGANAYLKGLPASPTDFESSSVMHLTRIIV